MHCPTHISGNRLYLVMTDVHDIADVVVGTPLDTSDHCFVSCVFRVEQFVPQTVEQIVPTTLPRPSSKCGHRHCRISRSLFRRPPLFYVLKNRFQPPTAEIITIHLI